MKKLLLSTLLLVLPSIVSAYDIEQDGIYYNLKSGKEAEVTYQIEDIELGYISNYFGSVIIPEKITNGGVEYVVTGIGGGAFYNCSGLTSVTIPNSVTSIGNGAFEGCISLTSVAIPNSVTSIGRGAFADCSKLTSVAIPNSVTSIGEGTFCACISLASISIPNTVTSIGDLAFECCENLTTVTIPNSVTYIGENAFQACERLKTLSIPSSVTSIGEAAFAACNGLTSVTINSNAATNGAFKGLSSIREVIIGNSVTTIGDYAFFGCSGLTSVNIPNSVMSIGDEAFEGCSSLTTLNIPNSVTSIGQGAFSACSGLTTLTIPNSVTSIGQGAFSACSGLTSVNIPNSVTSIGHGAFSYCGLTSVTIPNSVTSIGGCAFEGCRGLVTVTINSNSIMSEGYSFMEGNLFGPQVTSFIIGDDVTSIGENTFKDYTGLASITIGNSVKSIGDYAFYNCSGLTSVTIPNSVTSIGYKSFNGCSNLTSVTIGNSVTTIGGDAFGGCSGLEKVIINDIAAWVKIDFLCYTDEDEDNAFFIDYSGSKSSNPLNYAHHLYMDGKEIKDLVIPSSVTSIGSCAFFGCTGLTSVTIPSSIKNIGWGAFFCCSGLTSVISKMENPCLIDGYCFLLCVSPLEPYSEDVYNNATLYVPQGTIEKYRSTESWDKFIHIEAGDPLEFFEYNLSYVLEGETYSTYTLKEGDTITPEGVPTKEGYTFSGWSEIPATMPASDVTVTGSFIINKYKLIYTIDGEDYKTVEVDYGSVITPEQIPVREGFTFSGWSEIPETMPANDVTITGSFKVNKYKLIYMIDGKEYKTSEVDYGTTITAEAVPTKEGYTFSGWSDIPSTMPAEYVIVTGTFAVNKYTITYMVDDAVLIKEEVIYGSTITPPKSQKEGYDISWNSHPTTMPAYDITIYGSYIVTGINGLYTEESDKQVFTPDGKRVETPKKGLNIIRMSDGTVKKVVVK